LVVFGKNIIRPAGLQFYTDFLRKDATFYKKVVGGNVCSAYGGGVVAEIVTDAYFGVEFELV